LVVWWRPVRNRTTTILVLEDVKGVFEHMQTTDDAVVLLIDTEYGGTCVMKEGVPPWHRFRARCPSAVPFHLCH
jgi:hypothetical protein